MEEDKPKEIKEKAKGIIEFPLLIQAKHHDEIFSGELLDLKGTVRYDGQEYPTPTTAAKIIVTDWKEVNGWDFWKYLSLESKKLEKIGKLRN